MKLKAEQLLKQFYGENANFRNGQLEAIESTYYNSRTLVVQKTGWGKSLVYFLSTRLFRNEGNGMTLVVSPLLVLMENQMDAARKMNIKCTVLNSTVDKSERVNVLNNLINDKYDILFITPENLFQDDVQKALPNIKIGLFVIDEAHCISDWGHDFRLEYGKLNRIICNLPANVHVLATTATANDRVVQDLKKQLGEDVFVSRGPLTRESLEIKVVKIKNTAERYAWINKNLNNLPGSGIIYCLTQRDCDYLANFLNSNGINACAYYSKDKEGEIENIEIINKFIKNEIKVIVSTIKLGMGFDKGDIGFVIHYQMPSNIVSYYQQIGRAGRNIDKAYAILMSGNEDIEIIDYFINTAFPSEDECNKIIDIIENNKGVIKSYIRGKLNIRPNRIEKALMFLENDGYIYKENNKYYLSPKKFMYNKEHYEEITTIRKLERNQMIQLIETKECLNRFVVSCLDDKVDEDCGKCSNCSGNDMFDNDINSDDLDKALKYINSIIMPIEPRKRWPSTDFFGTTKIKNQLLTGICLSKYGDVGYGHLVSEGKYKTKHFCDELVGKSASVLKRVIKENRITYITCVPSLRNDIVLNFTKRLAESLKIEFIDILYKKKAKKQKEMENSYFQCKNAIESFDFKDGEYSGNILLVDDMIDSKWTMTVCGHYLIEAGFSSVFPFALADSSHRGDNNE